MEVLIAIIMLLAVVPSAEAQPVSVSDMVNWPSIILDSTIDERYERDFREEWAARRLVVESVESGKYLPAFDALGEAIVKLQKATIQSDYGLAKKEAKDAICAIRKMGDDWVIKGYLGYLIYIDSTVSFLCGNVSEAIEKRYCSDFLLLNAKSDVMVYELGVIQPFIQDFMEGWQRRDVLLRWIFYNYRLYLPDVLDAPEGKIDGTYQQVADFQQYTSMPLRLGTIPDFPGYYRLLEKYLSNSVFLQDVLVIEAEAQDRAAFAGTKAIAKKYVPRAIVRNGELYQILVLRSSGLVDVILAKNY